MEPRWWIAQIVAALVVAAGCAACGGRHTVGPGPTPSATSPTSPSPAVSTSSPPAEAPPPGSTAVRFSATDGVRLAGRLFGGGIAGVVLAHQSDDDQTDWWDFAEVLRAKGYLVLTFDFRGVCHDGLAGCSASTFDPSRTSKDVMGAARFIQSRGARTVVLIGASMGGEASIIAASKLGAEVDGLISLSASEGFVGPLDLGVAHRTVAAIVSPTLFVAGKFDREFAGYAADFFSHARPPKSKRIFGSGDHGIALLRGGEADAASALVFDFLSRHR